MSFTLHCGDALSILQTLADKSVHCCVTSPPYFGLRDYNTGTWQGGDPHCQHRVAQIRTGLGLADAPAATRGGGQKQAEVGWLQAKRECPHCGALRIDKQIGIEQTPEEYIANLVAVFREVRRVLRDDGTLWVNIGDSYANDAKWGGSSGGKHVAGLHGKTGIGRGKVSTGLKPKDLIGIPWELAFALRADGWHLRQDIVWCLSGGAWVYAKTQKGEMPMMIKDLVRLEPSTVELWNGKQWTRVLGWGESADTGDRLEVVLRSGERIGCTAGHQWPTTARGNVTAENLRVGDIIASCQLPEPKGCNRPAYLTDDALWLIGLYLAEGSRSGKRQTLQLSLSADEQGWVPRIEAVAKHYGGSCGFTVSGGSLSVRLYGSVLRGVIDAYIGGRVAADKHLKVAAWMLTNESLALLIGGYLDGDGHRDLQNDRWRLGFCRNYSLERDLRTLAARLGATITLVPCSVRYQGGARPAFRGEWRWGRSGHGNEKDRSEIVEIRASRARQFWDIAVEDEPHLFALASGVLTHNCKPNPMPESVKDRCTKAHEYIFLLSKSERYFWDREAMREPATDTGRVNGRDGREEDDGARPPGSSPRTLARLDYTQTGRNKRSVWPIANFSSDDEFCRVCDRYFQGASKSEIRVVEENGKEVRYCPCGASDWSAHYAMFPPELPETCIRAGCPEGGLVLDPFSGCATTGLAAIKNGRRYVGIELNPESIKLAKFRARRVAPLLVGSDVA